MRAATVANGVTRQSFLRYVDAEQSRADQYARALASGCEAVADDCQAMADDPDIPSDHKRIMVDTRKWLLSKRMPKRYGDKMELAGDGGGPLVINITATQAQL